jgi:heptosyltransferase-1
VLLIRLSAIGDVVVTTPVARALRAAFPEAYLAWVVEPKAKDAVLGNPFLDEVIVWDRRRSGGTGGQVGAYRWLARELRARRFDVAIDFQGLLRSGLIGLLAGARHRIGNTRCKEPAGWLYTARVPRPTDTTSSRQRCLDLLQPLGVRSRDRRMVFALSEGERQRAQALLAEAGVAPGSSYAAFAPATTWRHKHWLDHRWGMVADRLREEHGLAPVFLGGPADGERVGRIRAAMTGPAADLCGRTSLKEAAAVVAGARLALAVDTGLLHIAAAVGTPLVGVCGASYWPGFQDYDQFRLVREPFPCSPCLHHPICRYVDCMQAVGVGAVVAAGRELLVPAELAMV